MILFQFYFNSAMLYYGYDWDIVTLNSAMCKAVTFLEYWLSHLASWVLVLVTAERFIGILFPFKARVRKYGSCTVCVYLCMNKYMPKYGQIIPFV